MKTPTQINYNKIKKPCKEASNKKKSLYKHWLILTLSIMTLLKILKKI